jgi:CDGSH iron-sulfur domain-containing protein 2
MLSDPQVVNVLKVSDFPSGGLLKGKKAVYCRCWKSGTFPLCDAAHVAHNKETGDK